jgi:preprotein translocase subunit SecY
MIGIIANLPQGLLGEFVKKNSPDGGGLVLFLMEMVILLAIIVISILLVQGTRRIDIHFAKKVVTTKQGAMQYGGHRSYLPLKVNAAGVMPIIFAQAIMFVPVIIAGFATEGSNVIVRTFSDYTSFWYNFTFGMLIVLFTYFYTAISVNPQSIADELKRNGGFIQGKKPGKETAEFIDNVLSRITLPGSIFLAFVAILPSIASKMNVNPAFAQFFGGTSLLILVGVVLDTLAQIDSHLKMRQYDGLMKGGRIKGRSAVGMVGQY